MIRLLTLLIALLVALPAAAAEAVSDLYVISAGDTLEIVVFEEADLSRTVVVDADGNVDLPLLGTVSVAGMSRAEADDLITALFKTSYLRNPLVTVYIDAIGSKPVEVTGAVTRPGRYHLRPDTTSLVQIIGEAGGIAQNKNVSQVIVRRAGQEPMVIDRNALFLTGEGDLTLHANDVVIVPEALVVYVAGEVKKPGTITWSQGLSVSQALTQAGGPDVTASLRNAYILRDGVRIPVNLRRIFKGSESDITLEPDDQLFLRQSIF